MKQNQRSRRALAGAIGGFLTGSISAWGAAFIQNPSFENNWNDVWPHYGAIDAWSGGSGVNDRSLDPGGPFHDNGRTPDRDRVAFKQQNGPLSQEIYGLTPGQFYWIQYFYNSRGDSIGGACDITTRFGETDLDKVSGVVRVATSPDNVTPFNVRTVPFTPDVDAGTLSFVVATQGDRTALFDAVSIVPRSENDVAIANPSFEASGTIPAIGPLANLAGWTVAGTVGVDTTGSVYADNGTFPDQDLVAFIEGPGSLTQTIRNLVPGTQYELRVAYNARSGNTPRLEAKVDETVLFTVDATAVGGASAFRTRSATFTPTTETVVLSLAQLKDGTDALLLDDIRLIGQKAEVFPPLGVAPKRAELAPGQSVTVKITVPTELLAKRAATIVLRSSDTNLVQLTGAAEDGTVTLQFAQGGPDVKTLEARAIRRGSASLNVVESAGLEVPNGVLINVVESFVRNPSFDAESSLEGAGYGDVLAWTGTGATGVNTVTQPFAAGGSPIPDRLQVAFIQGAGSLSQDIAGLTAGSSYWLQFRYNLRENPDPNGPAIDLVVKFAGETLASIGNLEPPSKTGVTEYFAHHLLFTPTASSGRLEFVTANPKGDASLLLDAVNIVRRNANEIVLRNPSFEASGAVDLYLDGPVEGWTFLGAGKGTDADGPFNNGRVPEQDLAFFLQGAGSVQQKLAGFTAGWKYTLVYSVNARDFPPNEGTTHHTVSLGAEGAPVVIVDEDVVPQTGAAPYTTKYVTFTADAADMVLEIAHVPPPGDKTFLLDSVRILPGEVGPPPPDVALVVSRNPDGNVRVSWPSTAAGFVLQSTTALPGGWSDAPEPVVIEDVEYVVTVAPTGAARYFRLSLP